MTHRTLMGLASAIGGALALAIAINGWWGIEAAVVALMILGYFAVFLLAIYLLYAALVLLTHDSLLTRFVKRMKQ